MSNNFLIKNVLVGISTLGFLFYLVSLIILLRYRKIHFVRQAIWNTSLIVAIFVIFAYILLAYPFLFKGFSEEYIYIPVFFLPFFLMANYNLDIAFFFVAPYYWLKNKRKREPEASMFKDLREALAAPSHPIRTLIVGFLYFWIFSFSLIIIRTGERSNLPWFVPTLAFIYIFNYMLAILILLIHSKIRRCRYALLNSILIPPIIVLAFYLGSVSSEVSPPFKIFYLLVILLFLSFAVGWLDLLFFFASPCLFFYSRLKRITETDTLKWAYDFPSPLCTPINTVSVLLLLYIFLGSWFVVDWFFLNFGGVSR